MVDPPRYVSSTVSATSSPNGIPCSARGSGCGAIVSYVLELSHVDPLEYDLLFERFLDPNRSEAPDIDIDFCQDRREEVIAYVKRRYGEASVAQIATFGTLAARAAVKDVGRVLDVPLVRVAQLTEMIPKTLGIEALRAAVSRVLQGEIFIPSDVDLTRPSDAETTATIAKLATLTPQQVRVLMMLSAGLLNKQIAYELGVSEATVKAHVSAILQKLGVESRTQAVIAAGKIEAGSLPQVMGREE